MNILLNCLVFGNRPLDIIHENLNNAGYPYKVKLIDKEGIANAMNEGLLEIEEYDAIGYLSNDIIEPNDWLLKKVYALAQYPEAGIVSSSLDYARNSIFNELLISNYLIKKELVDKIGGFNEQMFPYGPIDLDYCERAWVAGYKTYYVKDLLAHHIGFHAKGDEYGWNKEELVRHFMNIHEKNIAGYKDGSINIKMEL